MFIHVTNMELKVTETFVMNQFYTALHDFLFEEGYAKGQDADFPEHYYYESRTQKGGKEYWVWWRCNKGTGTPFAIKHIHIDLHGVGIKDVEIMYQNKKIKANKGKIEVIIRGQLEVDPGDKWKDSKLGFLRDAFLYRWWHKELDQHREDCVKDVKKVRAFAASFMKKPIAQLMPEMFAPKKGYERENF
ncbi:MAG: hypothetical protein ACOCQX_03830 [Candidatus Nanoarchaeia archaeon]